MLALRFWLLNDDEWYKQTWSSIVNQCRCSYYDFLISSKNYVLFFLWIFNYYYYERQVLDTWYCNINTKCQINVMCLLFFFANWMLFSMVSTGFFHRQRREVQGIDSLLAWFWQKFNELNILWIFFSLCYLAYSYLWASFMAGVEWLFFI